MIDKSDRKIQKKRRQRQLRKKGSLDRSSSSLEKASLESVKSMPQLIWNGTDWRTKSGHRSPIVSIRYKLCPDGYKSAGCKMPIQKVRPRQRGPLVATSQAMADTGCSTMVAGVDFIHNFGLNEKDLVPVAATVKAANKTDIKVIGAVMVEAKLNSPGVDKITKQVVFISPMASRPYLNLEACKQLGLVPDGFPKFTLEGR